MRLVKFAPIALLALASSIASAQNPAFTVTDTNGPTLGNGPFTLGFSFTANSAIDVTALGIFDDSQDGLLESHSIGLFDSVGNLLSSSTLSSGTTNPLTNQFRYVSITPVSLTAGGSYTVGAVFNNNLDGLLGSGFAGPNGFTTDPSITYLQSAYASGGTLSFPNSTVGSGGYFGPNFKFSPTAIPEASTVLGFGSMIGMGGMGFLRRRKTSRKA